MMMAKHTSGFHGVKSCHSLPSAGVFKDHARHESYVCRFPEHESDHLLKKEP